MGDKEILYQMLFRELDNLMGSNQMLRLFSEPIKNWIVNFIDPYVNAFFMGTNKLDSEVAGTFVKEEVNNKINAFIKKFEEERKINNPNDFIV
jgi:translation initiation factor 2 beta subunit (eIF-2beta)/eIF-5